MSGLNLSSKAYKPRQVLNSIRKGIRPALTYPCPSCPKVFSRSSYRSQHKLKKHKGGVIPCSTCPRTFVTQRGLHHHQRARHGMITEICADSESPETSSLHHLQETLRNVTDENCPDIKPPSPETTANLQTPEPFTTETPPTLRLEDHLLIWRLQTEVLIARLLAHTRQSDVTL